MDNNCLSAMKSYKSLPIKNIIYRISLDHFRFSLSFYLRAKMIELDDKISNLKSDRLNEQKQHELLETEAEKEALKQTLKSARDMCV